MKYNIYQAYYRDTQTENLDPDFLPYNNTANPHPKWGEYWFFLNHYRNSAHTQADYSGIVSWRFSQKTGITGREFIDFIKHNPGHDVYFINPETLNCYQYPNVWVQSLKHHPEVLELTQHIFDSIGYEIDLGNIVNDESNTLYCNYWAGNAKFWETYMRFTLPVFEYINETMTEAEREKVYATADRPRGKDASNFVFIFERLFSTLLVTDPDIKALAYRYDSEQLKNRYSQPIAFYFLNERLYSDMGKMLARNTAEEELVPALDALKQDAARIRNEFGNFLQSPLVRLSMELDKYPRLKTVLRAFYRRSVPVYQKARAIFRIR